MGLVIRATAYESAHVANILHWTNPEDHHHACVHLHTCVSEAAYTPTSTNFRIEMTMLILQPFNRFDSDRTNWQQTPGPVYNNAKRVWHGLEAFMCIHGILSTNALSQSPPTSVYFTDLCETLTQVLIRTFKGSILHPVYRTLTARPALSLYLQAIRILYYSVIRSCALGYGYVVWSKCTTLNSNARRDSIFGKGFNTNFDWIVAIIMQ